MPWYEVGVLVVPICINLVNANSLLGWKQHIADRKWDTPHVFTGNRCWQQLTIRTNCRSDDQDEIIKSECAPNWIQNVTVTVASFNASSLTARTAWLLSHKYRNTMDMPTHMTQSTIEQIKMMMITTNCAQLKSLDLYPSNDSLWKYLMIRVEVTIQQEVWYSSWQKKYLLRWQLPIVD